MSSAAAPSGSPGEPSGPRRRFAPQWLQRSVRNKLLAMALAPLIVVLPLLGGAMLIWGNAAYDSLLIAKVRSDRLEGERVLVKALLGSQFGNVPATAHPDQVTLNEEDRIMGYFGAGTLYAEPGRAEPLV